MRRDDGFTLIETLVALAVLATGAVALLGVVEDHTGRIAGLEDRVTLRWVAENRLAARHLGLEVQPAWDAVFGRRAAVTEAGLTPDRKTRIFGPGAALTMDFREDRVNVELDAADRVVRIYCG